VRNVRNRLRRFAHKHKGELLQHLVLHDSSESDQEEQADLSCNWLNHGGLMYVNEMGLMYMGYNYAPCYKRNVRNSHMVLMCNVLLRN